MMNICRGSMRRQSPLHSLASSDSAFVRVSASTPLELSLGASGIERNAIAMSLNRKISYGQDFGFDCSFNRPSTGRSTAVAYNPSSKPILYPKQQSIKKYKHLQAMSDNSTLTHTTGSSNIIPCVNQTPTNTTTMNSMSNFGNYASMRPNRNHMYQSTPNRMISRLYAVPRDMEDRDVSAENDQTPDGGKAKKLSTKGALMEKLRAAIKTNAKESNPTPSSTKLTEAIESKDEVVSKTTDKGESSMSIPQPSTSRDREKSPSKEANHRQKDSSALKPSQSEPDISGFGQLGLDQGLVTALNDMGFTTPTPVQRSIIPRILRDESIVVAAATGSGKTLAFVLPVLQQLVQQVHQTMRCIIDSLSTYLTTYSISGS